MEQKNRIRRMVLVGVFAALVFAGSLPRITVPAALGTTSFHLGNIFCALSGILLGPLDGALAAGLGSMLYDLTNPLYVSECWITFLTKGAYGLVAGLIAWSGGKKGASYPRNLAGTAGGAVTYALLYLLKSFAWTGLLVKGLTPAAAAISLADKLPATLFNAVVAILCAPVLAEAVQRARAAAWGRS